MKSPDALEPRNKVPVLLAALGAALLLLLAFGRGDRVGDGMEYYAMLFNLAEFGRPYSDADSWEFYDRFASSNRELGFAPREQIWHKYEIFKTRGDQNDFPHFWFFSLLAVPFYHLLSTVGAHPAYSFTALNLSLLVLASTLIYRFDRSAGTTALTILFLSSPVWWFFNKAHTEFFTFLGLTVAIAATLNRSYGFSALVFAVLSTQNPPFAIASMALLGMFAFSIRLRPSKFDVLLVTASFFFMVLHPTYYLARLGIPTPQLLRGISNEPISFKKAVSWIIDPDIGLIPHWPLGLIILVGYGVILWRRKAFGSRKAALSALLMVAYVFLLIYFHSKTSNVNSGGTLSMARYAIWYLPLWYLPMLAFARLSKRRRTRVKFATWGIVSAYLILNMWYFLPSRPENYTAPTTFSRWLYGTAPHLYDPYPEIFLERYSGLGQRALSVEPWAISHPAGRKILIIRDYFQRENFNDPTKVLGNEVPLDPEWLATRAVPLVRSEPRARYQFLNLSASEAQQLWPTYTLGRSLEFSRLATRRYLGSGWGRTEEWGVWTEAPTAVFGFKLVAAPITPTSELILRYRPWLDGLGFQEARVVLNDKALGVIETRQPGNQEFRVRFPSFLLARNNLVEIRLGQLSSPKAMGLSNDPRLLGLGVTSIELRGHP